ncbi:DUF6932 family protein [Pedobacter sp. N23S346]|uniref:DUF6932 family protein n=1 Tax=Pedobacter sp. N23S346 TaxID=3402750 RepID=UPI003AD2E4C1
MIPLFDEEGYLPSGIYEASLTKFEAHFSTNLVRKNIFQGFLRLIADLKKVGCGTVFVDGSYVTRKEYPKDIDVCWDDRGLDLNLVIAALPILWDLQHPRDRQQRQYRADVFPAFVTENGSKKMFLDFFQQIKGEEHKQKGIIKININD